MPKKQLITKKQLLRAAHIEKCRRSLWHYCKTRAPTFYRDDRPHLRLMADTIQDFLEDPHARYLIIEAPPRHGKSRTLTLAVPWVLGVHSTWKVITGSYNETLSTQFSVTARNEMAEEPTDPEKIIYQDIFSTRLQPDSKAKNLWRTLGSGVPSYLATSPTGTVTGMGGDVIILDDLIKNAEEACNETVLEKHWTWFRDTLQSRLEGQRKIIIVMTRWAVDDLAGRLKDELAKQGESPARVLTLRAETDGEMLCPDILPLEEFERLKRTKGSSTVGLSIFSANYQQEPLDAEGRLYGEFLQYDTLPPVENWHSVRSYTDTADTGSDFLCSFAYLVDNSKNIYILDVVYTQEDMTVTEEAVAAMLARNEVNVADIESNNGGMGFARNVKRILREGGNTKTQIKPFTQTQNKAARILSGSSGVMNTVHFPINWQYRWPELFADLTRYQRAGKNKHDDAPDALTGCWEKTDKLVKKGWKF